MTGAAPHPSTMMEIETPQNSFDWANDAYLALNDPNSKHQQVNSNWGSYTIPPALLSHATIERYGQVTPPEELSPAEPLRQTREDSIPVEQLRNEPFWPTEQFSSKSELTPPQDNNDNDGDDDDDNQHHHAQDQTLKRRRQTRQASINQSPPLNSQPFDDTHANPQPPKRKRGRPKSQPQMVEAFTADGYPFQVSSARQSHLEKNRVAAHKCRQRKKEYINGLEGRAREFSTKNKLLKENVAMLREEVLTLKNEVLRHAGCGFWAVDEYLARCAGDLLGMEAPRTSTPRQNSTHGSVVPPAALDQPSRDFRAASQSTTDLDDFGGLELLKDFDDEDMDELESRLA